MKDSILSTKTLTESQVELVLNTGISLTHYDLLKIQPINIDSTENWNQVIITSQNAIPALLAHHNFIKNVYCVGEVTAASLKKNGVQPIHIAPNARGLAKILINNYPGENFLYLCSEQRRDELPALFLKEKIPLKELFVYRSIAVMKSFDRIFAAVIFYSPRGVHAFAKANPHNKPLTAICIGKTTASTATSYYKNVKIATKQTVENTLITAIKALRND
ncbi:uroporphyrinogen-III synthase [Nonlabens sp. Ci31]|jgi:uroporphyrinogen-III synthase|uniref:uroporphyrinogen-III synthase n=1 Tax=Nonlabens sp. Ci31 TaxID=2608253 RepID=UPI001463BB48|nr:uroporphyrinogen-III synthase [Nonlabens sp. Ci31]QJP33603.1 uroporphyrinogen-III synthase [Nonlabens sp. Ci31]